MMHKFALFGLFLVAALCFGVASTAVSEESNGSRLVIPEYVLAVPKDHFAGVSSPSNSLRMSRNSAINDAVRQVLGSMGASFNHLYIERIHGNPNGDNLKRLVDDRLSGVAQGIVMGIEQNIVQSSWIQDDGDRYVYFVLVHYPERLIREMRRLSKGAKVVVSVSDPNGDQIILKVAEINGVSVIISSMDVRVRKKNRFAKGISFFVWHVPKGSESVFTVSIDPFEVCNDSATIRFSVNGYEKSLFDYLLGAKLERIAVLKGHDELGRDVKTIVPF